VGDVRTALLREPDLPLDIPKVGADLGTNRELACRDADRTHALMMPLRRRATPYQFLAGR
jgi:hypothetical protein